RDPADRQRTARVLAGASQAELADLWREWPDRPDVEYVRGPEQGLVMVQARAGGRGDRFHLGEATVTRATVAVRSGGGESLGGAIDGLEGRRGERDAERRSDARSTVVDFFTVARENDGSDDEDDE